MATRFGAVGAAPRRFASGINILEAAGHARDQEDEQLLKRMTANNPGVEQAFACLKGITEDAALHAEQGEDAPHEARHTPVNGALFNDTVSLVEDGATSAAPHLCAPGSRSSGPGHRRLETVAGVAPENYMQSVYVCVCVCVCLI